MVNLENAWDVFKEVDERDKATISMYDVFYKISTAIFKYRESENLTQKELAERLEVTQAMVSKLESGVYNYTVEQLSKIADKLNFTFDIIFKRQDSCDTNWNFDEKDILSFDDDTNWTRDAVA